MTADVGHGLRFSVLGPLEVSRDPGTGGGRVPVPVPGRRQRAVLACLLVHAGRPVRPDVLIDAAWGEGLPEDPRAALHTVVSRLRSALGQETVTSGPAGYALRAGEGALDVERFEDLRDQARSAGAARAAELLADALALWRGPALAEHAEEDFAAAEAARLDGLRLDAVEEHAAACVAAGDPEGAVAELEPLLADEPFREHAVELLMTALYRAGRHVEALDRFRAHRELLADELGLDPAPALVSLESRILGHALPASGRGEDQEAPQWLDLSTAFVGRESWVGEVVAAAAADRVVTVCGPGGVGKSRLVAQSLPALLEGVGPRAAVVELGPVRPGGVAVAVADALGLQVIHDKDVVAQLAERLGTGHRVLVLDCCEHVREEVAGLVGQLLRRCPRLGMVTTSRHRLEVPAERVLQLGPLPAASPTDPAAALFVDRVRRLRPAFDPGERELAAVVQVCRRLDGLPLAIEIAASRAATLGVAPVLDSLRALEGTSTVPVVDLEDVVAWSARLLTGDQRRLLRRLSVFVGEFDLSAAAAVGVRAQIPRAGAHGGDEGEVAAALAELVESNLLVGRSAGDVMSYRMLTLVRAAAAGMLDATGETGAARLAHLAWAAGVAAGAARDWLTDAAPEVAPRLARCTPDLVAAVRRALAADRPDLAAQVTGPVQLCLHLDPALELGDLVVEVAERCADSLPPAPGQALGVAAGAMALTNRGETDRVRRLATSARDVSSEPTSRFLAAMALAVAAFYADERAECAHWLGQADEPGLEAGYAAEPPATAALLSCFAGDLPTARQEVAVALTASRAAGARAAHAFALYAAGEVEVVGDPEGGAGLFREAVALAGTVGATHVGHVAALALYAVLVRRGHRGEAVELVGPLLTDLLRVGSWPQVWTTLRITAELLADADRPADAALVLAAVDAAPGAPPLVGDDPRRYADLRDRLDRRLGEGVVGRIGGFAAGLRRAQVVDRAVRLLAELAA